MRYASKTEVQFQRAMKHGHNNEPVSFVYVSVFVLWDKMNNNINLTKNVLKKETNRSIYPSSNGEEIRLSMWFYFAQEPSCSAALYRKI